MSRLSNVSVVLISYNGEKFIEKQVLSILAQLENKDELVISDDGSSDNTESIISSIGDPRIKYVHGPRKGINSNIDFGINVAKNNFIMLSDQDDIWLPGRVEYFLAQMKSGVDFVFFDACVIDSEDNLIIPSYFQHHRASKTFFGNLIKCRTLGCCIAFKKNALKPNFQFAENYSDLPFDYYLTLYALAFCKVNFSSRPYHLYRRHDKNVSSGGSKSTNSVSQMFHFRARVLRSLLNILRSKANWS